MMYLDHIILLSTQPWSECLVCVAVYCAKLIVLHISGIRSGYSW